jgi:hypothetical protein
MLPGLDDATSVSRQQGALFEDRSSSPERTRLQNRTMKSRRREDEQRETSVVTSLIRASPRHASCLPHQAQGSYLPPNLIVASSAHELRTMSDSCETPHRE